MITVRGICCVQILFVQRVAYWFFSSWNLYINFSPHETNFARSTCWVLIFSSWNLYNDFSPRGTDFFQETYDREAYCMLIFLFVKFIHLFFPRETDFVHGTCAMLFFVRGACSVLIFVHGTCSMLIFLFVKLADWFFSSWNWFCSWSLWQVMLGLRDCIKRGRT